MSEKIVYQTEQFNMRLYPHILILLGLLLCDCAQGRDLRVEQALELSGKERKALEEFMGQYERGSLGRRVSEYLVAGMPYHHTLRGKGLGIYHDFHRLYFLYGREALAMIDSIQGSEEAFDAGQLKTDPDITGINPEFVTMDIGNAMRTRREVPWGRNVREEDFIRYVAPYRIQDEVVINWRDHIMWTYRDVIDSLCTAGVDDPLEAGRALLAKWNESPFRWTSQLPSGPAVGPSIVEDKAGTCLDFAHGVVYLMRGAGIPCGIDMVPVRGENSSAHYWPFIIGKDGRTYVTCTERTEWVPAEEFDIVAAKVYRTEYGINDPLDRSLPEDPGARPRFFRAPLVRDVTREYKPGEGSADIRIPVESGDDTHLYLASWGNNEWVAVDHCRGGGEARFRDVSGGVILVVARMDGDRLVAVSAPFEVTQGGKPRYITPGEGRRTLTAYSKFPLNERNGELVHRCIGGVIEGSDDPGFTLCDTVYRISELARRRVNHRVLSRPTAPHRYYRYRGAEGSNCNIAEVMLYAGSGDTVPLRGRVFGTPGASGGDLSHDYRAVFDGDVMTSFDYSEPTGGWSGLDLGRPVSLGKVGFVPRNRDNYVRAGDDYELFWFGENHWNSAGRQVAFSDSVDFTVPPGTLYYLKNHTRGRSERIFEYDFGTRKQHFW